MIRDVVERIRLTKDPKILVSFAPSFRPRSHKKAEPLLRQGDVWRHAFFIEKGLLRTHILGRDGKDFNKSFWAEGTIIFPITEEMEKRPSLFGVSALEPAVVWHADMTELRHALGRQGLWEPLRADLLARLLDHKLQREFDLLTLGGKERYEKLRERNPEWAARVPLGHLASYLGMTDVSLSRIRRGRGDPED